MIRQPSCPICGVVLTSDDPLKSKTFPFCSERCRNIDYFRWSEGKYAITEPIGPDDLQLLDLDEESGD